jgi:hypothetical protein
LSIPVDTYFVVTPASQFISKAYANLNGTDLFFYVAETNALRVVNMNSTGSTAAPGSLTYTLALNAKWVDVIAQSGVVYVYYGDLANNIWCISYRTFGSLPTPVLLTTVPAITFSTIYTGQSSPPVYQLMVDDGVRHRLYVAHDPLFQTLLVPAQVTYNNTLDTTIYLSQPSIAMHPLDTDRITVTFQQTLVSNSTTSVGFYEVRVPGVA